MITITNLELLIAFVQEFSEAALFDCLQWVQLGLGGLSLNVKYQYFNIQSQYQY